MALLSLFSYLNLWSIEILFGLIFLVPCVSLWLVQCKNQLDASPPLNWTVEHSPHMICFRNFSWGFSISLVDVEYCCCEAAAAVTIWNRLARLSSIEKPDSDRLLLLPLPLPPPEISLFSWLLLQSENTHLIRRGMIFFLTSSSVNQNLVSSGNEDSIWLVSSIHGEEIHMFVWMGVYELHAKKYKQNCIP